MPKYPITQIEDYEPLIGSENIERIHEKARKFRVCGSPISIPPITEMA
jgi:hypothetical protein